MKVSSRFGDYAVVGALLLGTQLAFLWIVFPETDLLPHLQARFVGFVDAVPSRLVPALNALLAAIGLVAIVILGLALDLCGSYFALNETRVFAKILIQNREWMDILVRNQSVDLANDIALLCDHFPQAVSPFSWEFLERAFRQEKLVKSHTAAFAYATGLAYVRPYSHLRSFLLAHMFVNGAHVKLDLFLDEVHVWRIMRALATVALVIFFELMFLPRHTSTLLTLLQILLASLIFGAAGYLCMRAFRRMTNTMFSLSYMLARDKNLLVQTIVTR